MSTQRISRNNLRSVSALLLLGSTALSCSAQLNRPHQDEIIYQIMPIAWRDSNNDAQRFGDFGGLSSAASLDYLQNLGVTMIYLQPIFPSNAYHGYQHGPADQLNTRFGTQAQLQTLIDSAHARGIKIILDFVAYGISHNSAYYTSAYNNPASTYDSWLAFTNSQNTQYTGSVYNSWNGSSVGFIHWNLATPSAATTVTNWAAKWLDPNNDGNTADGVDGFRLDHIYANAPEGWGANIAFWQSFCTTLRTIKPGILIFGEHGDWGSYGTEVLTPTGFDAVLTKPFEFAARDAVNNELAAGLYSSVAATLAATPAGKLVIAQTNDHDSDRLASFLGSSNSKQKTAAAVLFTQPFPPNIYYGDELGMRGTKGNWGSDANDIPMREPFKWFAVHAAPMSNYWVLNSSAYNNRTSQNNDGRSVQEQQGVSTSVLETYRSLIAIRRNNIALRHGDYTPVTNTSTRVYSFVRTHNDQKIFVAINLGNASVTPSFDLSNFDIPGNSTTPLNLITNTSLAAITTANRATYSITLPAYSYVIATVNLIPPPPSTIDGRDIPLDAGTTSLLATQTCATSLGDNIGELNQLYVLPQLDGLRIGITGNVPTDATALALMLESNPGGQNILNTTAFAPPPAGLQIISGTRLDTGFSPDRLYFMNFNSGSIYVDQVNLAAASSTKIYRGQGITNSGNGNLTGGTHSNGLLVAVDNTNTAGITASAVANASTATRGVEMLIPYADLGLPTAAADRSGRTVKISAALIRPDGTWSNQVLPGVTFGNGVLGIDPNFNSFTGLQYTSFTFCRADFNNDGGADFFDYLDFVDVFSAQDPAADFNVDGSIDFFDYLDFVDVFSIGC